MVTMNSGEILNNCCTYGTKRILMTSKCQFKEKKITRQAQAENRALDEEDYAIFSRSWD